MKKVIMVSGILIAAIVLTGIPAFAQEETPASSPAAKVYPKKVQVDTNYDGKIDRVEVYNAAGKVEKVESDTNNDGKIDEWISYKDGKAIRSEKDSNGDGKMDIWIDY